MNRIYFALVNGSLIDNYDIARMALAVEGKKLYFTDLDAVREFASTCKGIKKEIEYPSVKYLLKRGAKWQAIQVYHERHPEISISKCREIIDSILEKSKKREENNEKEKDEKAKIASEAV